MAAKTERRCTGSCGRTLPVDAENFYAQDGGDGFTRRCRECVKADTRERAAALRERQAAARAARPVKQCTGICDRELPADAEYFHRRTAARDGLQSRCRECVNASKREAARRPAAPAVDPPPEPCGFASDRQARFRLIQRRAEMNLRDHAAAGRTRRIMAAADRAVEEASRPPFDGHEILAAIAEEIEDNADVDQMARRGLAIVLRDDRDRRTAGERVTGRRDVQVFT
jgi:hypothetical protein